MRLLFHFHRQQEDFVEITVGKVFSANKLNIPAQQKIDSPDIDMPFF
jgi:hypothetical protein